MEKALREGAIDLCTTLRHAGHQAWLVGGCVRDELLNLPIKDIDITTDARPEQVERLFPKAKLVGAKFGVVLVKMEDHAYEVATFRKDGKYLDHRHPEWVDYGTMEEDARRRDLTINALYLDPVSGEVRDFSTGRADLKDRLLRCVGDPRERFREDALRLVRAIRFAARLGFEIEHETWLAIRELAPLIEYISPERQREELTRIFLHPSAKRGLELLDASGLLHWVLPEIEALKGVEQGKRYHPEGDVFVHTSLVLHHVEPRTVETVWAALLHDVAKPATFARDTETGAISFYEHQRIGAEMARVILEKFKFSNDEIDTICALVARHMMFMTVEKMNRGTLRKFIGAPTIESDLALHRADCLGSNGLLDYWEFTRARMAEFAAEPVLPPPLINGHDLMAMGIPPGPTLGKLLAQVRDLQLNDELKTAEEALAWVRTEA